MNVFSYYLLWITLTIGAPETSWRVEGGYDSCLLMQQMVLRYESTLVTRCERVEVKR